MKNYQLRLPTFLFVSLVSSLLIVACGAKPAVTVDPTVTSSSATPTAVVETATSVPIVDEEEVDQCVSCHTKKQMLIDTAKPEEEVISENEGAG